jgi:transposase
LRSTQEIAPVYLKKAERVVAFLHIHVMARMVAALIERKLRLAMKQQKIDALPIYPEKRACKAPTIFDIVRLVRWRGKSEGDSCEFESSGHSTLVVMLRSTKTCQRNVRCMIASTSGTKPSRISFSLLFASFWATPSWAVLMPGG